MRSSHQSSYDCFNPVFASICQFQEATYRYTCILYTCRRPFFLMLATPLLDLLYRR